MKKQSLTYQPITKDPYAPVQEYAEKLAAIKTILEENKVAVPAQHFQSLYDLVNNIDPESSASELYKKLEHFISVFDRMPPMYGDRWYNQIVNITTKIFRVGI